MNNNYSSQVIAPKANLFFKNIVNFFIDEFDMSDSSQGIN